MLFLRTLRQRGLSSPYGPIILACGVFLSSWLCPPRIYELYIQEPDRLFLDPLSFVFFFGCVAAFVLGVRGSRFLRPKAWLGSIERVRVDAPFLYVGVPLLAATAFAAGALIQYGAHMSVVALLLSSQGSVIKEYQASGNRLFGGLWERAPFVQIGILWWAMFRMQQLVIARSARVLLWIAWIFAAVISLLLAVATVSRDNLMSLLAGAMLILIFYRQETGRLGLTRAIRNAAVGGGLLLVIFLLLSFLRGSLGARYLAGSVMGYSVGSYNRFASVLHGDMTFRYGGTGIYLFEDLRGDPLVARFIDIPGLLHWPTALDLWRSEFASAALAGLNPSYIWAGVFGYLYSDIGWWTLLYILLSGLFAGHAWARFKRGTTWAVLIYPWIANWILLWIGPNTLFDSGFANIAIAAVILTGWERAFPNRKLTIAAEDIVGSHAVQTVFP